MRGVLGTPASFPLPTAHRGDQVQVGVSLPRSLPPPPSGSPMADIAGPGGRRDERVLADSGDIAVPGNQTRPRVQADGGDIEPCHESGCAAGS